MVSGECLRFDLGSQVQSTRITLPFDKILEFSSIHSGVEDFLNFEFFNVIYNDGWWFIGLLLGRVFGFLVRGEEGFIEYRVDLFPSWRKNEAIG